MSTDEKVLKILEELSGKVDTLDQGQKALQDDVASIKDVQQQQSKDIAALKSGQEHNGKLLTGLTASMATVLEEQQAQRSDIRSLHTEVHESREELKGEVKEVKVEVRAARDEAKRDNIDLKATVVKKIQSLDRRTTNIEHHEGIENPDKN